MGKGDRRSEWHHMSRRQMASFQALEQRRAKRKVAAEIAKEASRKEEEDCLVGGMGFEGNMTGSLGVLQSTLPTGRSQDSLTTSSSSSSSKEITQDMVDQKLLQSQLQRISTLLPPLSIRSGGHGNPKDTAREYVAALHEGKRLLKKLPNQPLKKHCGWLTMAEQEHGGFSLTEELEKFAAYISLNSHEKEVRINILADVQEVVAMKYADARVQVFGSYAAGLSIFHSDIDVSLSIGGDQDDEKHSSFANLEEEVTSEEDEEVEKEVEEEEELSWFIDTAAAPEEEKPTLSRKRRHDDVSSDDDENDSGTAPTVDEDIDVLVIDPGAETSRTLTADELQTKDLISSISTDVTPAEPSSRTIDDHAERRILRDVYDALRYLQTIKRMELRGRARVPIINFNHFSGVDCDISIGLAARDTTDILLAMKERCGPAIFALSAFLKIYLSQMGLDQPFIGGLGSFKLYVLIAAHIDKFPQYIKVRDHPNLGALLLRFLQYYGNPENLNQSTKVIVGHVTVDFSIVREVVTLQKAFARAFAVLHEVCQERFSQFRSESSHAEPTTSERAEASRPMVTHGALIIPGLGAKKSSDSFSHSNQLRNHQLSQSILGTVLNTQLLDKQRMDSMKASTLAKSRTPEEKLKMGEKILDELQNRIGRIHGRVTLEQVKKMHPLLCLRLCSYLSVADATKKLSFDYNQSFSAEPVPQRNVSFTRYGVMGAKIAELGRVGMEPINPERRTWKKRQRLPQENKNGKSKRESSSKASTAPKKARPYSYNPDPSPGNGPARKRHRHT